MTGLADLGKKKKKQWWVKVYCYSQGMPSTQKVGKPKTYSANEVHFGKDEGFRRQEARK